MKNGTHFNVERTEFGGVRRSRLNLLDSSFLDDLAVAPLSAFHAALRVIGRVDSDGVGAIVEYEFHRRNDRQELPPLREWCRSPIAQLIVKVIDGAAAPPASTTLQPLTADATNIPVDLGNNVAWTAFLKRAEATARDFGFADSVSSGFAGAITELADNVVQHSQDPRTGLVAFCGCRGVFEYVVADSGIGMLASLRTASEFRALRDDVEALPLAITSGVSRRGRGTGFGYGYRAVFLPLRAVNGAVRLRSGKAVLQVEGASCQPDRGRCSQRPSHQGVVATVRATTNYRRS